MDSTASEQVSARPERLEVPLAGGGVPVLFPLFAGLLAGITLRFTLSTFGAPVSDMAGAALCMAFGLGVTMLTIAIKLRQLPDRLRITPDTVELARGARAVSRVRLAKLLEVNEIDWPDGKVLLLSDDRRTLAVIAAQLADPRQYSDITRAIAEAVGRVDPTGGVARMAVQAAKLREVVSRRPMHVTLVLSGVLAMASIMAFRALDVLSGVPFPAVDIGALSHPLIPPESWRLVSYPFIHASGMELALCLLALLWIGGALEKLVGWERVLLCFLAGVIGGGLGHLYTGSPLPVVGSEPGVLGLVGLLIAVTVRARRHPHGLRPPGSAWLAALWFTMFFAIPSVASMLLSPELSIADELPLVLGGLGLGLIVGLASMIGADVPVSNAGRREWRPGAIVAGCVLAVGLVGGVTHNKRHSHTADAEIVAQALLHLPPTLASAEIQNALAYPRLREDGATQQTLDIAGRLALAAVENSGGHEPAFLDTLAIAQYKQGKVDEARSLLQEALKMLSTSKSKDDERVYFIVNRHLQDVKSGGPLRPDPDGDPASP